MRRPYVAALVLALAACTSDGEPGGTPTTAPAPATTAPAPSPSTSPPAAAARIVVTVGEGHPRTVEPVVQRRLAAFGIHRFASDVDGQRVTYRLPRPLTAPELAALQRTGLLAVRPVTRTGPPGECEREEGRRRVAERFAATENESDPVTGCHPEGTATYDLGPAEFYAADVRSADAEQQRGGWVVAVEYVDAPDWAALTERHTGRQLAFVLDGEVLSVVEVQQRVEGGAARIDATHLGANGARLLAAVLRAGPYPFPVTVTAG
jgi:preprotein translocase subunit SecD